jgi:hypothetical protein
MFAQIVLALKSSGARRMSTAFHNCTQDCKSDELSRRNRRRGAQLGPLLIVVGDRQTSRMSDRCNTDAMQAQCRRNVDSPYDTVAVLALSEAHSGC